MVTLNNNNEQTLILEPDESDAPGAEEPVDDGSAPDGPVRFRREIVGSDDPGAEEPVDDGSAPDGPVGFTRETNELDAPDGQEPAHEGSAPDGPVGFTMVSSDDQDDDTNHGFSIQ